MGERIEFDDVENVVTAALTAAYAADDDFGGVEATTDLPALATMHTRVLVVGGSTRNLITDEPRIVTEHYGADEGEAAALATFTRSLLEMWGRDGWIGQTFCTGVTVVSRPQNFPDPVTKFPRYSATYQLRLRGTAA